VDTLAPQAMKDVPSCEKPGVAAKKRRSLDLRMGQPPSRHGLGLHDEFNSRERAHPVN